MSWSSYILIRYSSNCSKSLLYADTVRFEYRFSVFIYLKNLSTIIPNFTTSKIRWIFEKCKKKFKNNFVWAKHFSPNFSPLRERGTSAIRNGYHVNVWYRTPTIVLNGNHVGCGSEHVYFAPTFGASIVFRLWHFLCQQFWRNNVVNKNIILIDNEKNRKLPFFSLTFALNLDVEHLPYPILTKALYQHDKTG